MDDLASNSAEIIVLGAGMAGATAAAVLGRQGRKVILVDSRERYPPIFKAEKIDREQVQLLRKFDLLDHLLPYAGRVREIHTAFDGRITRTIPSEQYGINYADMVNALRARTPASVAFRLARVDSVTTADHLQHVRLEGGEELTSRLIVVACGSSPIIPERLGLRRNVIQKDQSLVLGFTITPLQPQPFDFDSITYYSFELSARIDYLTLFKIRQSMRANLFVYRSAGDPWVRKFIQEPERMLRRYLPKLDRVTGDYRVASKVESGRVDLYRVKGEAPPGVVLIGDAYQSVCPCTGMGLDKVLTDVDVLSACVPRWFASAGMGVDKLADFYQHPRKLAIDSRALERASFQRRTAIDPGLRWQLRRFLLQAKWRALSALRAGVLTRVDRSRGDTHASSPRSLSTVPPGDRSSLAIKLSANGVFTRSRSRRVSGLRSCQIAGLDDGISVETGKASPEEWAGIIQNFTDANLYQTFPYAAMRWGSRTLEHLVLKREDEILAAAQVICLEFPFLAAGLAYAKWGPLWQSRAQGANAGNLRQILAALRTVYAHRKRMLLRVSPWEFDSGEHRLLLGTSGFEKSLAAETVSTTMLDLAHSLPDLRASLSRHWRSNLKRAEKSDLEVCEGSGEGSVDEFLALYEDMRRRKEDGRIPAMRYLSRVQHDLPESLKMRIMICRHAGVPIAGLVVSAIGSRAFAVAAATGSMGMEFRGSYLLQWRALQWLKDQNIQFYDLARINAKTHPGTTQFKLGLTGKLGIVAEYVGEYQACESAASHLLVNVAARARIIFAKLRSRDFRPRFNLQDSNAQAQAAEPLHPAELE